jgi:hypothetical protein
MRFCVSPGTVICHFKSDMRHILQIIILLIFHSSFAQTSDELIPYRSLDKWGYATKTKQIAIPPTYDIASPFNNGTAQVCLNKEWALIDKSNKILIPFAEHRLAEIKTGLFIKGILKDGEVRMGVVNLQNREIIPSKYERIRLIHEVLELEIEDKFGVSDLNGNILIKPLYDYIEYIGDNLCILSKDNLHALYNLYGEKLTDFKYMVISDYKNNRSKVRLKDLFGFINSQGQEIIQPTYEMVYPFCNGYAVIEKGGKYGLIDTLGKIVIQTKYDFLRDFHLGVASVKIDTKWGLIDISGKEITKPEFEEIRRVYNGIIAAKKDSKWAILNPQGQLLSSFEFDDVKISENDENEVRDFNLKEPTNDEGYLLISKNQKWGIIDIKGKIIVPTDYDYIYPFTNNVALIKKNEKWALIDKQGIIKTEFIYDKLEPYIAGRYNLKKHGMILYEKNGQWGILDIKGKEITPPIYDLIKPSDDNYYMVLKNKKMGIIDSSGKEILSMKYDKIKMESSAESSEKVIFINNVCIVQINGRQGYVSKEGVEYFE